MMESEYVACSLAVQEIVWLRRFFQRLHVTSPINEAFLVHCDSMFALPYTWLPNNIVELTY